MRKIIIYDSNDYRAQNNTCFQQDMAKTEISFVVELGNQAIENGFEAITGDVFLKEQIGADDKAYCITEMHSKRTDSILKKGAIPFMCICMESPIIARDYYINIVKLAGKFLYNRQFKGTEVLFNKSGTEFSVMHFPVYSRTVIHDMPWSERKYLVLINSNKRAFHYDPSTLKGIIRTTLSWIKFSIQRLIYPWMRIHEIYKDRIEVIAHFSEKPGFELFGMGWNNKIPGFPKKYSMAAKKCWKGSLKYENQVKLEEMRKFKFAICFENCAYPGYVTEKIFDCFLAGCIPIYYGAPDIEDFVPSGTFIEYRKFQSLEQLDTFLSNLKEEEARLMLDAAKRFLASKDFDKYFLKNQVIDIFDKISKHK